MKVCNNQLTGKNCKMYIFWISYYPLSQESIKWYNKNNECSYFCKWLNYEWICLKINISHYNVKNSQ